MNLWDILCASISDMKGKRKGINVEPDKTEENV
jgi:hypothetical protein